MRKILKIAVREYNEAVRTKAFVIGIIFAPIMMGGSGLAMWLTEENVDTTDKRIAVIDRTGIVSQSLVDAAKVRNETEIHDQETGEKTDPAYLIEIVPPDDEDPDAQRLELSNRVRNKELDAYVEIGAGLLDPSDNPETAHLTYHAENAVFHKAHYWIQGPINNRIRDYRLSEAGLDQNTVNALTKWHQIETLGLVSVDQDSGQVQNAQRTNEAAAIVPSLVLAVLMFMLLMMGVTPMLSSVLEEKTRRISEVLLGSVRPFQLMMGKLLGNLGVSFTVASVYIIGGSLLCYWRGWTEYVPYELLPWFFVYLIAAIFMFGATFMAVGAACNDAKEIQSLTMPVMLPMLLPMFVLGPVLKAPLGGLATWLSLFPPCTPMLMLLRQANPVGIPAWQPWVGLAGTLVYTVFCVWAGGRVFRVGLLMHGNPPKIRDLARWAIQG